MSSEVQSPKRSDVNRLAESMASDAATRGFPWPDGEIRHTSRIVALGPKSQLFSRIFDEIDEKDPDVAGMLERIYTAIMALPRFIVPGDETDGAKEAAALCREVTSNLKQDWKTALRHSLTSVANGIAFIELNWRNQAGVIAPVSARKRPIYKFGFKEDKNGEPQLGVRIKGRLQAPPPGKFIVARFGEDYPWGDGLKNKIYWYWKAKLLILLAWAHSLDRWARPVVDVGFKSATEEDVTFSSGVDESVDDKIRAENAERESIAERIAKNVHGDGIVVRDMDGISLDLKSASASADAGFLMALELVTRAIARLMLGEANTMDLRGGAATFASYNVSEKISTHRTIEIGNSTGALFSDTLFRWLVDLNLPRAPYPRLALRTTTLEAAKVLMEGAQAALEAGFGVPRSYLAEVWRIPGLEPGDELFFLERLAQASGN